MPFNNSPVIIGSDHAAYLMKEKVKEQLLNQGIEVYDIGATSDDSVDYPDIGLELASMVSTGRFERGILLCGTGLGMSMVANRLSHVRAALCNDLFSAEMSRRHNDSNILVMGGRVIGESLALKILSIWLATPFDGGRHQLRLEKFDNIKKTT